MKLNDVAVTPHMGLLPEGNRQQGDGLFRRLIMLKSNMVGAIKSEARLRCRESDQLPNRAKSVRFAHLAHHP